MKHDFPRLYSQLGLHPECSLEEFKHAYRRRITEVHPDKQATADEREAATIEVSELNSAYAEALRFHKLQGRLPGSKPQPSLPLRNTAAFPGQTPAATTPEPSSGQAAGNGKGSLPIVLLLVVVLALLIVLDFSRARTADGKGAPRPRHQAAATPHSMHGQRLKLGMTATDVLAVQGQPVYIRGEEWGYGPSWLRFEKGRLVDWHSSPLRRLQTDTQSPPQQAGH